MIQLWHFKSISFTEPLEIWISMEQEVVILEWEYSKYRAVVEDERGEKKRAKLEWALASGRFLIKRWNWKSGWDINLKAKIALLPHWGVIPLWDQLVVVVKWMEWGGVVPFYIQAFSLPFGKRFTYLLLEHFSSFSE